MTSSDRPSQRLILEAGRADRQYWGDIWRYRELFFILAWRDVAVRYKQTVIGLAWAQAGGLLGAAGERHSPASPPRLRNVGYGRPASDAARHHPISGG